MTNFSDDLKKYIIDKREFDSLLSFIIYIFIISNDKIDIKIIEYEYKEIIFDMKEMKGIEIFFYCIGFDFLYEFDKSICNHFNEDRE